MVLLTCGCSTVLQTGAPKAVPFYKQYGAERVCCAMLLPIRPPPTLLFSRLPLSLPKRVHYCCTAAPLTLPCNPLLRSAGFIFYLLKNRRLCPLDRESVDTFGNRHHGDDITPVMQVGFSMLEVGSISPKNTKVSFDMWRPIRRGSMGDGRISRVKITLVLMTLVLLYLYALASVNLA